jgi:hypothetical protein
MYVCIYIVVYQECKEIQKETKNDEDNLMESK